MRFVRTCKLIQQARLATRNTRTIRKTRSAAIAMFLEEQNIARFKKSPVSSPASTPPPSKIGRKRKTHSEKGVVNDVLPSCSKPKQLLKLTKPEEKKPSEEPPKPKTEIIDDSVMPPIENATKENSTQTDLVLSDDKQLLLKNIDSKGFNISKINNMLMNEDYFATYPEPNESYNKEMYDENDNHSRLMSNMEHQALLSSYYAMAQEQAKLNWLTQMVMSTTTNTPSKCTIVELDESNQSAKNQDVQIVEQPRDEPLFEDYNVSPPSSSRTKGYYKMSKKNPK